MADVGCLDHDRRIRRFRGAPLEPEFRVLRKSRQRFIKSLAIFAEQRRITRRILSCPLPFRNQKMQAFVLAGCADSACAIERRVCSRPLIQLLVGDAQPYIGQRLSGIEAQRLVERTRRFNPHVIVQVAQPLVVEALRLRRGSGDPIV